MAVAAFGVFTGVLGIIQFGLDNFAAQPDDGPASVIRVQVGLETPSNMIANAGGDLPDARTFNLNGESLGITVDPGNIDDGSFAEYKVGQENTQQPVYTLFSANNDAICIALVTIVWPDDQKYAWTGGFARLCGLDWFYSDIIPSGDKIGGQKLECMWIDGNGDQPYTGFQVYWPAYKPEAADSPLFPIEYYCNDNTVFSVKTEKDPNSIFVSASKNRRRAPTYSNEPSLVISSDPAQSAVDLCQSPSSWGPDFLNIHHGWFCQTIKKKLYPVCSATVVTNCFNVKTKQLVRGWISARDEVYTKIIDWTHGAWEQL